MGMGDSREIRAKAFEVKFLVTADVGNRVRDWARRHLAPDPHGSGPFADQYRTASVYFDTATLDVFHRRRSFGRSKYRVRRYGDAAQVFLERKLREPGILVKRRTVAALDSLPLLNGGANGEPWPGDWFARRVSLRGMVPVCLVSYQRTARWTARDGHVLRLTLDESVAAEPVSHVAFGVDSGTRVLEGQAILELKYTHHLPAMFKHLVEEFALEPTRGSKYRCGMVALSNGALASANGQGFLCHA
jgi:hypothetical protein